MTTLRPARPVLRYHGGKYRMADWIIGHFPAHEAYIEPFGGAASVLLAKTPSRIEVYNDLDDSVVSLFRILRDPGQAAQLQRAIELTPFSRVEHAASFEPSDDPIEEARRFIVRSFQSIGTKNRRSRNGWRTRTPKAVWSSCVAWTGWPAEVPTFCGRLRDVIIESLDFRRLIPLYDHPDALFYVDPPYVSSTRSSGHRKTYTHEMSDADHADLLQILQGLKGMVALSGYDSDLYAEALKGWRVERVKARAQTNAGRQELLWLSPNLAARYQARFTLEEAS